MFNTGGSKMKKLALVVAVAGLLTACGSTRTSSLDLYKEQQAQRERFTQKAMDSAPEWMFKLPKSANAIYQSADETGASMSSAKMFAEAKAYAKICTSMGGRVRSQTKFYEHDTGSSSSRNSEIAVRNICPDVDISGVEVVETVFLREGSRVRAMVLVALPVGDANAVRSARDAENKSREAFKELDNIVKPGSEKSESVLELKPAADAKLLDNTLILIAIV
jgi:hypothetical protein